MSKYIQSLNIGDKLICKKTQEICEIQSIPIRTGDGHEIYFFKGFAVGRKAMFDFFKNNEGYFEIV